MMGAVIGDICGSIYEFDNHKTDRPETIDLLNEECYYTDDTVLTAAVAQAAFGDRDYAKSIYKWARAYPKESYGYNFRAWFNSDYPAPYNSFGNGAAMRVSPIGWAFETLDETIFEAERSAACTHNHIEGIKGAQATATAVFLARKGSSKEEIKSHIETVYGYNLSRTLAEIRGVYQFDESCQGTVPEAITAFLESKDFTHAIQCAISIGGDSDTLAAITGGIAEAYYLHTERHFRTFAGIPDELLKFADTKMNFEIRSVIRDYYSKAMREFVEKAVMKMRSEE